MAGMQVATTGLDAQALRELMQHMFFINGKKPTQINETPSFTDLISLFVCDYEWRQSSGLL